MPKSRLREVSSHLDAQEKDITRLRAYIYYVDSLKDYIYINNNGSKPDRNEYILYILLGINQQRSFASFLLSVSQTHFKIFTASFKSSLSSRISNGSFTSSNQNC